jgi:hypothetical protein
MYRVELLSRQVVRVIIPKGIYYKDGMVDIHVATPYGVSPALQVPVLGTATAKPAPTTPASAYKVSDTLNKVKLSYALLPNPDKSFMPVLVGVPAGSFRIDWESPTGNTLKVVDALFTFSVDKTNVGIGVRLAAHNGYFEIADNAGVRGMTDFINEFLNNVAALKRYSPDKPIPTTLEAAVKVTPVDPAPGTHAVKDVPVTGKVQLTLEQLNIVPTPPPPPHEIHLPQPRPVPSPETSPKPMPSSPSSAPFSGK